MPAELTWAPVSDTSPEWRHVWLSPPPLHLLVRVQQRDTKLAITHVLVAADSLNSTAIISVPMGRIARLMAIHPPHTNPLNNPTPATYPPAEQALLADALDMIARLTPRLAPLAEPWTAPKQREPLNRPPVGPGYDPDAFYRRVAHAHTAHLLHSNRVANAIATEADVPLSTARAWIREARRRGHIAPGNTRRAPVHANPPGPPPPPSLGR